MTTRERRERRAERLQAWAEKREVRGTASLDDAHAKADQIPFGQPILVGHHSERADRRYRGRIESATVRGVEDLRKAESMSSRAANIEAANDRAIYSDDVDAVEQLRAKIERLEAERAAIKTYNAGARKAKGDTAKLAALAGQLPENLREDLLGSMRIGFDRAGMFPAYRLTNLGSTINTARKRLADVERRQARRADADTAGGVSVQRVPVGSLGQEWATVTFADKPERAVLDALKAAGFRWSGGSWHGYADKLPAEVTS